VLNYTLPSASHPPSIWYEAVAAPKRKPSGNVKLSWAAANPVVTKMTKQTVWNLISLQCQAPCTWECQSIRKIVSLYVRMYVRVCVCVCVCDRERVCYQSTDVSYLHEFARCLYHSYQKYDNLCLFLTSDLSENRCLATF